MFKKGSKSLSSFVPLLIIVSIILAFTVGILWQKVNSLENSPSSPTTLGNTDTNNSPPSPAPVQRTADNVEPVSEVDHVLGERDARIALIEYSDFECPYCASFHPTAQQVVEEYDGQVMWVYRHFPLDQIHPNARPAAEASECVTELGGEDAFWQFVDEIFSNQSTTLRDLETVATGLGIDKQAYQECIDSGRYEDLVEAQYQSGISAGVTGTPGNILLDTETGDTLLIPGAQPFGQVSQSIEQLLSE
jgi:protein-disulfide isomerase